jgi:hypothetical protein
MTDIIEETDTRWIFPHEYHYSKAYWEREFKKQINIIS